MDKPRVLIINIRKNECHINVGGDRIQGLYCNLGLTTTQMGTYCDQFIGRHIDDIVNAFNDHEIVILTHPLIFPLFKNNLKDKLIVYDCQKPEGFHEVYHWEKNDSNNEALNELVKCEYELSHFADLIFIPSSEDRNIIYSV